MKNKDALIDLLIHDLTAPLAVASTSVNGLLTREEKYGPYHANHKETLKRVHRNVQKARTLLQEIIEVYRAKEGLFTKEQFSIHEALRTAFRDAIEVIKPDVADALCKADNRDDFDRVLRDNGMCIEVNGKYGSELFTHDQRKVMQIIRNLVTNALKYRKKNMKLSVAGDRDLVISVEDDGEGIPKEKRENIFKRFRGVNDQNAPEGLGFGLSCVRNIIETMGGEVSLKCGEESGSCFTVRIPPL
jgi:signal transduction histidine kinase